CVGSLRFSARGCSWVGVSLYWLFIQYPRHHDIRKASPPSSGQHLPCRWEDHPMSDVAIPLHAIKGRGTATRIAHRFERDARDAFDDGWGTLADGAQSDSAPPATQVTFEDAKSALTHNDSPDIYFDYGLNPYRGCEHGCVYCYARPTHSYLGLSPGLDFETRIIAKRNLAAVLARELAAPRYVPRMIALGTVTDPYQPAERELRI